MVPTYNCAGYLANALRSVLKQDPGTDVMQIEVIDDCSSSDDPEAVVKAVGKGRVAFYRQPKNLGAIANFNSCIERSKGRYVHILHGDDTVEHGYYACIAELIRRYPDVGLYATRNFYVDTESVLIWLSPRLEELEVPSTDVTRFYYECPMQFAGVTVSRQSYEELGGFRTDLLHTADVEMWTRIISSKRGVVSREVMANYRTFPENDTGRLAKTGENVRDICRLSEIFASRYPDFSMALARRKAAEKALRQYREFSARGEKAAADINRKLWLELTPFKRRMINYIKENVLFAPLWQS
jgi:glycosyltransferase involved in cell wall biosynthesis